MYNLCMYYEKQKSYDETELTFQPTLVYRDPYQIQSQKNLNFVSGYLNFTKFQEKKSE